jgi:hypothetical protein
VLSGLIVSALELAKEISAVVIHAQGVDDGLAEDAAILDHRVVAIVRDQVTGGALAARVEWETIEAMAIAPVE